MSSAESNLNIKYSQNEIVNGEIIQKLVNQSSITKGDLVYDIGAGTGVISEALIKKGARVIAIENDDELYLKCKQQFINQDKFKIYCIDFLKWDFPQGQKYKVFSNIPFIRTADIVNRILFNKDPPEDCYLIIQKEAAEKFTGIPVDTLASLLIKPIFWVDIIYHFKRQDFHPVPSVDIVLLQVEKRRCRLVPERYYGLYKDFVVFCREGADRTIKKALKNFFTYSQLKLLSRLLNIDYRCSPAELNFMQYLTIFQFYLSHGLKNVDLIRGAEENMRKQQAKMVKIHRTIKRKKHW